MFDSTSFNYINVLTKAADASNRRKDIISNNLANVSTPGFKRKDLDFESVLKRELGNFKYTSLDSKIKDTRLYKLNPVVYTDRSQFSYRLDGNNVDIDTENVELASETIKYQTLTQSISSEFNRMRYAMGKS
ncbi:flagellar basal body rod protein FlgB [Lachnobacterium bovis]|uniref:Flagellar basal body rod protein FlgB n=1 Tax=Lachnobacterium bovis DSM 14045 TaxID=1122142 RepID=A0A1H3EWZ1_9FIRM|nr:flagellar basal body rod protein FlgB [Lachnobacterium bovis]MBQ1802642.1 flagellar basal body rod protein FlgB [Lachnobacterium sp.]SDX83057.1 flagellar basal-body rod protein FlgB [Lachnobacterium bovis DSM 14045]